MMEWLDKNSPRLLAAMFLWTVGSSFGAGVWATTISLNMDALKIGLTSANQDRYRGTDAARDFALRDERAAALSDRIAMNSRSIEREVAKMSAGLLRIEEKLDNVSRQQRLFYKKGIDTGSEE